MSKDHNTITCTHGRGLACPVCYDQTHRLDNLNWSHAESQHDLSQCGDACNCMKCNPSKSSCIDLRAIDAKIEAIGTLIDKYDDMVRFSDLPDGTLFYLAQTYAYGSRIKLQKTLEDGGEHNAVHVVNTNIGVNVPDDRLVIRA